MPFTPYTPAPSPSVESKGAANGIASLDSGAKVPTTQLPSYVDDVLEYASTSAFPAEGETGKIYVALDTNKSYRWSGSTYVELSSYAEATQSASGLMSSTDKAKLDGISAGATAVTVSNSLSDTSTTNALSAAQGKVLKDSIDTSNSNLTKSIKSVCPIAEGNTHSAFVAGMVIYIRNHSTLTEGSYTVTQYVAQNATLSDSNVKYNYYGGLDVLNTRFQAEILANTDLNSLTTPGFYYTSTVAVTDTLSNCPNTGYNFTMFVMTKGSNNLTQIIFWKGETIYTRSTTSGVFGNWVTFSNDSNHNKKMVYSDQNLISDSNSTVNLGLSGSNYVVVSVYSSSPTMENVLYLPYLHNNTWRARAINAATGAALSSLSRGVRTYYFAI